MRLIGIALWCIGSVRLHKDGDGFQAIFRIWHPATWLMYIVFTPLAGIIGEKVTDILPTRLTLFWHKNRDQLQWVTPFTKLDTLKPFKHNFKKE